MKISKVRGFLPAPEDGKPGADGKDSVSAELSTYSIVAKYREGTSAQAFPVTVTVLKGGKKVPAADYKVTAGNFLLGTTNVASGGEFAQLVIINVLDGKTGAASVNITVEYDGATYVKTVAVSITKDGVDGQDAYVLDLDNEMDSVPCDSTGKTVAKVSLTTNARLYKGSAMVTAGFGTPAPGNVQLNGISPTIGTVNGVISFTWEFPAGTSFSSAQYLVNIPIYNAGVTYYKTFTVAVQRSGSPGVAATVFSVLPSVTSVKVNADGVATPTVVTCKQLKQVGSSAPVETTGHWLAVRFPGDNSDYSYWSMFYNGVPVSGRTSIEFVLYESMDDKTVLDRETVPVIYDGKKGDPGTPGNPGGDGNGIQSQTNYYLATTLSEGVTPSNPSSGWVAGVFQQPQALKPYAWRFTRTVYTKTGTVDSPCELIATFQGGTNPNLLDATTFESLESMEKAWDVINRPAMQSGSYDESVPDGILSDDKGYQGKNAFRGGTKYSLESLGYKDILRQPVVSKLKPSTWYTLSYFTRCVSDSLFYTNMTSHLYGFCRYKLYLQAGHTYYAQINGFISAAAQAVGRTLRAYIYGLDSNNDWTWSTVMEIDKTSSDMKSVTFSVPTTGVYYITFYSHHSSGTSGTAAQTVTVERCYIRDWNVIAMANIFPSVIDTDVKGVVDGTETKLAEDGAVQLAPSGWTYHTYTFKTKAVLPVDSQSKLIEQYVLFRLMPGVVTNKMTNASGQSEVSTTSHGMTYAEICMPKLEEGLMATGYIPSNKDLKGDKGPTHRGPQFWKDVPVGFNFQAGGDNDLFFDTIIYNDNFYSPKKSHTKTADNYPGSTVDQTQRLWNLGDKFDVVATKVFFAAYALVKNLGVEVVEMKDSKGNIIFQVKDGNVICKTGKFDNIQSSSGKFKIDEYGKLYATEADISGVINASFLNMKVCDTSLNGSMITSVDEYTLPQIENGRTRVIWYFLPTTTRVPSPAVIKPANSKVKIYHNSSGAFSYSSFNISGCGILVGIGGTTETTWNVYLFKD